MTISPEIIRLIDEIRDDTTHGASELARRALEVLKQAAEQSHMGSPAEFKQELDEIGRRLMDIRPSMAPLYNTVRRLLTSVNSTKASDLASLRQSVTSQAGDLIQASVRAVAQIAALTADLMTEREVILTHSYSSTVTMAVKSAHARHALQVIVTRSGAGRTGERTVWELHYAGIPVTFIDDTSMGLYVSRASKVLVGADRICADGGLVNGIGTCLLALAAKNAGVPFYVLCETLKFDSRIRSNEVELEEKGPEEVALPGSLPEEVEVRNPYFDVTPPELITGVITENGLIMPGTIPPDSLQSLF